MPNQNFLDFQSTVIQQLNQDVQTLFDTIILPNSLKDACYYAMTGKGKRVRPLLVASTYRLLTKSTTLSDDVRRAMLAVELLHTYSLIHDDLPCMDDDDMRRGRETLHIVFGDALALLAGDALQSLAFEVLATDQCGFKIGDDSIISRLLSTFAPRARRMVSGQTRDIEAENQEKNALTKEGLESIHMDKTGALIEASVLMGAVCASCDNQQQQALTRFAQRLGLAFQVQDDILDITADSVHLGKPVGSDEKLDKATYVKFMGLTQAKHYATMLFDESTEALQIFDIDTAYPLQDSMLMQLSNWLWQRNK